MRNRFRADFQWPLCSEDECAIKNVESAEGAGKPISPYYLARQRESTLSPAHHYIHGPAVLDVLFQDFSDWAFSRPLKQTTNIESLSDSYHAVHSILYIHNA